MEVRELIAARLGALSDTVKEEVVSKMVETEVEKRSNAIVKVLDKLTSLEKDKAKIDRPDQTTFNKDGSKATETYSKARLDELAKVNKQIEKITNALNKAIEKGEMGDVYNYASGKAPEGDQQKGSGENSEQSD